MNRWSCISLVLLFSGAVPAAEPFALKEGDRVVLLGNTLIEREQRYGYWELALTARFPGVTFRNLGWSGDTVWGEARAGFGSQADGFRELKEHVLALKPTVLIIGYGGNEAFAGPAGLPKFEKGLNDLLDALAPTKARVVLLTPPPQEKMAFPLPDPSHYNKNLVEYRKVIRSTAIKRQCAVIGLLAMPGEGFDETPFSPPIEGEKLTENGIHFTAWGYWSSTEYFQPMLDTQANNPWVIDRGADGTVISRKPNVMIDKVEAKGFRFRVTLSYLICDAPLDPHSSGVPRNCLHFTGLPAARKYTLYIDGKPQITATGEQWDGFIFLADTPEMKQAEKLRQLIVEKNRLYFHRWRPQNVTYIFGFRKGEQGKNAVEIPQFDPLIAEKEAEIARLRVPVPHVYEIKPEK